MTEETAQDSAEGKAIKALTFAFYSLHDLLVSRGVLGEGEAAANLRRLRTPDPDVGAIAEAIAQYLDAMPFAPATDRRFTVIDGDKPDN